MKKLRLLSLLLCVALLCQTVIPASAAETVASTQETQPVEQQTAQIPFGQVCIENGCRTLNGMRPLAGSDSRLDTAVAAFAFETTTETVIYSYNPDTKLPTGTLAKIVTALVAIENSNLDDIVTCSDGIQSKVPGSSLKMKPNLKSGEQLTVNDLLHGLLMIGANDAAVALAEHVAGVTELFVEQMNNRARELGMKDTHFVNCTGLTAEGHVTSAHDIALMSRELLLHHPEVRNYTTIWMDTLRSGTFGLSNTNKLIRFYEGATGLKTGFTQEAGYCISATAERDGMELITVIMKGTTSDSRNTDAKTLLNYGFSTYTLADIQPEEPLPVLPVTLGTADTVALTLPEEGRTLLLEKSRSGGLTQTVELPETVAAPIQTGQQVGTLTVRQDDTALLTVPIVAAETVEKLSWSQMTRHMLQMAIFCG